MTFLLRYLEENWTDGLETVREADKPPPQIIAKAAADITVVVGFSTADVKSAGTKASAAAVVPQEQVVLAQVHSTPSSSEQQPPEKAGKMDAAGGKGSSPESDDRPPVTASLETVNSLESQV